ncbi:hypothetical protein B0T11DRAFT_207535, partial [Plectosphaerella cucumerina]
MIDDSAKTCWFFIDDSNTWIEAPPAAAVGNVRVPKLTDGYRNPRPLIDIGQLVKRLSKDRSRGPVSLYGSRPSPNDSVWDAFERSRINLYIFDRNDKTAEKEINTTMTTNIIKAATRLDATAEYNAEVKKQKANTIFVIVTSDGDMMPSINEVLKVGIHVEIWALKSGMAPAYKQLRARHPALLSLRFLDSEAEIFDLTN